MTFKNKTTPIDLFMHILDQKLAPHQAVHLSWDIDWSEREIDPPSSIYLHISIGIDQPTPLNANKFIYFKYFWLLTQLCSIAWRICNPMSREWWRENKRTFAANCNRQRNKIDFASKQPSIAMRIDPRPLHHSSAAVPSDGSSIALNWTPSRSSEYISINPSPLPL